MDNKHLRKIRGGVMIVFAMILSVNLVMAAGISGPYWKSNPLKMAPGETKTIEIALANGDSVPAQMTVELTDGNEIAEITSGMDYTIPPLTSGTVNVILRISMPRSAEIGDEYNIRLTGRSADESSEGTVQLGVGYNFNFPVIVEEVVEPISAGTGNEITIEGEEEFGGRAVNTNIVIWIVVGMIVLIMAFVIYLLLRKKNN